MTARASWNDYFLELARTAATRSKDPSTQVGCVVVRKDKTVAGMGYNGFPPGVRDSPERYEDREIKYAMVVHAEANAIINSREDLAGATIYCTLLPCSDCGGMIIRSGIKQIYCPKPSDEEWERWGGKMEIALTMFKESGVHVRYS